MTWHREVERAGVSGLHTGQHTSPAAASATQEPQGANGSSLRAWLDSAKLAKLTAKDGALFAAPQAQGNGFGVGYETTMLMTWNISREEGQNLYSRASTGREGRLA